MGRNSIKTEALIISDFKILYNPACEEGILTFSAQIGNISDQNDYYVYRLTGPDRYIVGVKVQESNLIVQMTARMSGAQTFTLTVSTGESTTSASIDVIVNPAPAVDLSLNGVLDCTSPNVILTATPIPGAAYSFSEGASQNSEGNTATIKNEGLYSVYVTYPNGCVRSSSVWVNCTTLPVKLASFDVKPTDAGNVYLKWNVTEQVDIAKYIVEFSNDAKNFTAVGKVDADQLTQTEYQFEHIMSHKFKIAYYRLRIQELAGSFAFSRIVSVKLENQQGIAVYPNPASKKIWVKNVGLPGSKIQILGRTGVILKSIDVSSITQQIDISSLQSGFYIIKTEKGESFQFFKD